MRVTTWAEYGVIIALHLARRGAADPISARVLAEVEGLPPDYVEQIFLRLRRAGLVESVRGAKGGYRLARLPSDITIKDVFAAAEKHTFEVNCDLHQVDPERCKPTTPCSIRPLWRELHQRIDDFLTSVSLADLMMKEPEVQELVELTSRN